MYAHAFPAAIGKQRGTLSWPWTCARRIGYDGFHLTCGRMTHKPTIFFSHSSKDRSSLQVLRDLFDSRTGRSIDVFMSSDGQSIPFGRNWVHEVESGLDRAKLMFVFLTPNSIKSSWLYFEAGHAYSKGIRVVPVGMLGIDLALVPPPLSLIQGFNVKTESGS